MRGSFSIEASLIVPLVLAVMVLALRTGIDCYEETKAQVAKLGTRVSFDIVDNLKKDYKIVVLHPYPTRPYGFSFDRKVIKTEHYEDILLDSYVCPQSKILGRFHESYSFGLQCKKYIARYVRNP